MKTEPIHRTSMWKFKLSASTMTLIPAAVGINYVAKALAEGLKLPVWLGSLGTFLASGSRRLRQCPSLSLARCR